jgi:hypothetical protein
VHHAKRPDVSVRLWEISVCPSSAKGSVDANRYITQLES